ncbi:P-loop containing nucleoside triphosphate hydrolase protein [Chytridium lagenaria]|nr:P-loop containing nucleoside triphosphate hydrolase protein [Chytridium lagenaria]
MATASENPLEVYAKGTKAWFADEQEGWVIATLKEKSLVADTVKMVFSLDQRGKDVVFETSLTKLVASKFADLPPLKNPPMLEGIDDLANLSYLHEPAVLHNVRLRYLQEQIYTYSGIVLIAMNPFQRLALYSPEIMREYSGKRRGELEPHLFAVAEDAYRTMIREGKNQSIIVSGESGAGKTQSAKYIMRYFAIVDDLEKKSYRADSVTTSGGTSEIEEAVLSTNPIMESFGNSKTSRNDNSSRFGKYIEILFSKPSGPDKSVRITGAKIRTYLLERSRLIFQPATERNYHIFYQLCAAVPAAERKEYALGRWNDYHYLSQGGTGTIPGFDDAAEFAVTQQALSTIGISVSTQWDIFKICAALLHIGNIKITAVRDEALISDDDPALITATKLLGINKNEFKKWIVKKQIITRSEKIVTSLNQYQATVGRDSVAKFIYSMLFDWLVKIINKNLAREDQGANQTFIGVLDIYGFEHFKKNSFEQFCINYANEKLQQEFNQHVFKLEQEEYINEKINWSFIDFNDNQPCIDMIENKLGILDLLDEESRLPSGSDGSLITKLYQRFATPTQQFFEKPRFGQKAFTIKHYACDVTYEIDGFIEKNKDTVSDEQLGLLNSAEFAFLQEVVAIEEEAVAVAPQADARGGRGAGASAKKPTLGSIFKASLVKLMATLRTTEVHYIRCIKPNQTKVAFAFEPQMVLAQLRACGVLETIRISCAGYPSRWTYQEFADRYYLLVPSQKWSTDARALTKIIVSASIGAEDKYQMGLTKIFFRAGQLAFLEKLRSEKLRDCVVLIQKNIRKIVYRNRYRRMRAAAIKIQTAYRGYRARQLYRAERERIAATRIQTQVRMWLARRQFQKTRKAVVLVQSTFRMHVARRELIRLRQENAAIKIQKVYRGHMTRKWYKKTTRQIILLQSCTRRRKAIKELKVLKTEAKSVGKLKELNYKLENKVVELSQSVKARDAEIRSMVEKMSTLEGQVANWKEKFSRVETNSKAATVEVTQVSSEMKAELRALQDTRDQLTKDNEKLTTTVGKKDTEIENLQAELAKSKEENKKLREDLKNLPKAEDAATTAALKKEVASLREQMQKLIAGKWTRDRVADSLIANAESGGYAFAQESARPSVAVAQQSAAPAEYMSNGYTDIPPPSPSDMGRPSRKSTLSHRTSMASSETAVSVGEERTVENEVDYRSVFASILGLFFVVLWRLFEGVWRDGGYGVAGRSVRTLEDKALEDEIIDSLITNLRIPLPRHRRMLTLMTNLSKSLTMKFEDDYVSAFWLSNCFELLCVVKAAQNKENRKNARRGNAGDMIEEEVGEMIVPAVIENQSLPGYVCKQSGAASQLPEQALQTLRCYYMEESMARQILTELLRVIGVSAFNHILMRKNFCTWKRGVQIQYNVSRLEEWCTSHYIAEATLHLQQLLQAAKLLTLNKTSPQDIETIFDVCFLLNPTQIKKLLSLYYAADFDSPLSPELLKIVASRAVLNEKSDVLLLDLEQSPDFTKPMTRAVEIEKFIPAWISLPHISAIVTAS